MGTRAAPRGMAWVLVAVALVLASGTAWSFTHELPPPSKLPVSPQGPTWQDPPAGGLAPPASDLPLVGPAPGWREFIAYRETLRWVGGVILAVTAALLLCHLAIYGFHHLRPTGQMVRRYPWAEVLLHGVLGVTFVGAWASSTYLILAKYLRNAEEGGGLPLGRVSSTVHVVSGLVFLGALVVLAAAWRRSMRFERHDAPWLLALGGYLSRAHRILPAGRFNAGQKIWFRGAVLLGFLVVVSGALLYYPGLLGLRGSILSYVLHTALGVALSAAVIVHVYLAVVVHPHAVRGMLTGKVDEACMREDYPLAARPGSEERAA